MILIKSSSFHILICLIVRLSLRLTIQVVVVWSCNEIYLKKKIDTPFFVLSLWSTAAVSRVQSTAVEFYELVRTACSNGAIVCTLIIMLWMQRTYQTFSSQELLTVVLVEPFMLLPPHELNPILAFKGCL